jgi:tetratricopeptide (TPR) repeat protein
MKSITWIIVIVVAVFIYNSSMVSAWRNYNNGMRAYKDNNYQQAAGAFGKAYNLYNNQNLKFNECISEWAAIMKKQNDLKINSIADSALSEMNRKLLQKSSIEARNKITNLLTVQSLKNKQLAILYYALGKLYLLENRPDDARVAFQKSVAQQENFKPALKQLVRERTSEANSTSKKLLLATVESEPIELMSWKPF